MKKLLIAAAAACASLGASAQTSIGLGNFQLTASYALDRLGDSIEVAIARIEFRPR
jgi:hypothetical protein